MHILLLWIAAGIITAQQPAAETPGHPDAEELKRLSRYFLLTGVEPPRPFRPVQPRTIEDERKLEAIAWFCTARRLIHERRLHEAVEAYKKALALDPKAPAIYEDLLPLLQALGRRDELAQYLAEAVEVDPENYDFLYQLAIQTAMGGDNKAAEELLRRAWNSPRLPEKSAYRVRIAWTLGRLLEAQGRLKAAAEQYAFVLNALQHPRDYRLYRDPSARILFRDLPGLYERIGRTLMAAGQYELARSAFERGRVAAGNRGARFYLLIAETYLKADQPEEALRALENYIRQQRPQGAAAYRMLVDVLTKLGRQDEIVPRLRRALEADPQNQELRFLLATQLEQLGKPQEAEALYREILGSADDPRVLVALAALYWQQGKLERALELLGRCARQAIRPGPQAANADRELKRKVKELVADRTRYEEAVQLLEGSEEELPIEMHYLLGQLAKEAGDTDRAVRHLIACRNAQPARLELVIELHELLMEAKRYDEAAENLRWALQNSPWALNPNPIAYAELARALLLAGKLDEAARQAERTLQLMPTRATGYVLLGWIYTRQQQYDRAVEILERGRKAVRGRPDEERRILYQMSNVYYEQNNLAKTEEILREIIRRWPEDPAAYNDLGYIWADHDKNLDEAENLIRRALELYEAHREPGEPEKNPAYLDSMGWVLYKKGRYEEARKYLEEAAAAPGGDDGVIWDHLGDVYWRLGLKQKAIEAWRKAEELLKHETSPRERKRIDEVRAKLKKAQQDPAVPELKPGDDRTP